jgi:tetratricopeptide (TPR) repeat protein
MRHFRRRLGRIMSATVISGFFAGVLPAQSPDLDRWRGMISAADQLIGAGHFRDAEQILQAALEQARHLRPVLGSEATTYNNLGTLYWRMHAYDESAAAYQRSLHLWEETGRPGDRCFQHTANNLIGMYVESGNLKQAEYHQRALVAPRISALNSKGPEFAKVLANLGSIELLKHHDSWASSFYEEALAIWERDAPNASAEMAGALNDLGVSLMRTGETDRAFECNRRAMTMVESIGGPFDPMLVTVLMNRARLYCLARNCAAAEAPIQRALALAQNLYGQDSPVTAMALSQYSAVLKSCNRKKEALAMNRQARDIGARCFAPVPG